MNPEDLAPPDGAAWDLLVIGGGTAGIIGAKTAASLGASVLLLERERTGGDCLWTGCVPSKALLAAAHAAADARAAARYGIHVHRVEVNFAAVMASVHAAIAAIEPVDSPAALRAAGVRVALASARLTGPGTAQVDHVPVRLRQVLLATGAAPSVPPIPGMLGPGFHTSDTIWEVTELPGRLLVLGGGSVGCELGQAFARLGSTVTIVETAPRLLPSEDPDASELLASALRADGIDIRTSIGVTRFADSIAELADGSRVEFDVALLAIGRTPRTVGLGLTEAGVDVDARGHVIVDRHLRTSNPRVWAAGDVTTYPQFTHCAGVYASTAASNAVLGLRRSVDPDRIPRVTFTQPEIAAVGIGVEQARRERLTIRHVDHRHVDRAVAEQRTAGFSRLILDCKGRVAGATLVGPRAGEALAEVALAIAEGLRVRDLAASMHAYPTYADGVWNAAIGEVRAGLARPSMRTVTALLGRVRRRRVSA